MIICCGEALIDMIKGEGFEPLPGGSPFNTAVAIGRMGVPVKFLGRFSTDFFGEILLKRLRSNKVGDELVLRTPLNTTLAFVKTEKGKEPQYLFYAEGTAACSLTVENLPKKLPAETRCIVFGSIAMTVEPIASTIETMIQRENALQGLGKDPPVISFDPNIRPFVIKDRAAYIKQFEKWIAASTIAKISAADFQYVYPGMDMEKALHKILAMGPRMVISTLGPKGAVSMLRRNDGSIVRSSSPAVNLPVVDTIGAGDVFHGAFLSWLEINDKMSRVSLAALTEDEINAALYFANKAAALVCSKKGSEPPTLKEVMSLKEVSAKTQAKSPSAKKAAPKTEAAKKAAVKPAAGKTPAPKKK